MRILILTNQPYPNMTGGSANKLIGETKYLDKNNHRVYVISSRGGNKQMRLDKAKDYAFLHQVGFPYVPLGKSKHIFLLFKMLLWFIVNFSYFITCFFKSLWFVKEIDVISIKGIHSDGLCGVLLKKLFKKRLVYEHAGGFNKKRAKLFKQMGRGKYLTTISLWFNTFTEKIVYRNCDAIMTQDSLEDYYRELGFKGDYHIIPNGRDTEQFYPRNESALKKEYNIKGKVILFVGRLAPVKNVDKIINAFDLLGKFNVSLVIVGDGELREELHEKANQSKGPNDIIFVGAQKDVAPFYNIADVVVIASDYEGLPGVLIEAMACEKIVVASPVGVIPKVIINNLNGYLLPEKWTEVDLARGIIKGLMAPLSVNKRAKKTIDMNYSWNVVINKFIEIYSNPFIKPS